MTARACADYNHRMITEKMSLYDYMRAYRQKKEGNTAFIRGGRRMTFGRLFREVERVAGGLAALGVRKGDVVMLALPTIEQGIVAFYAVSRLGAVASMIHPLMARGEFERAVAEQRPKAVFLSDVNFQRLGKGLKGVKRVVCPYALYCYIGLPRPAEFTPYSGDGSEPAVYMRSGGTSGDHKTVVLSAAAVNALTGNLFLTLADDCFDERDRMLTALPMFHGFGLFVGLHTVICVSAPPVLMPVFRADKAVRAIARHKVTLMIAVPGMINKLLNEPAFAGENVKSLRHVYVGGDTVDGELEERFDARMREAGTDCVLSPGYGLTETGSVCVLSPHKAGGAVLGKPLLNMSCRIVDEKGADVPQGETGELLLTGNQLMTGYLDDEAGTAAAYVELGGVKWLKTGDMFRALPDGDLFFMGRKKRLIKISGVNVFPAEIERAAVRLPYVPQCAAIEVREQNKPFIALFVTAKLSDEQIKELKRHIVNELSKWHEPKYVVCVDALPRTQVGKIDHVRLSDEFESYRKKSS